MMIDIEEAQKLMGKFLELREKMHESEVDAANFERHENLCIEKFSYLVHMHTHKYRSFVNYEDLNQDGLEYLMKAMKTYNPKKGANKGPLFFHWAHKYISTRIARSANLHTTIRYPLKIAKEFTPHKENNLPLLIEDIWCPDKQVENLEIMQAIHSAMDLLKEDQKAVVNLAFGFD